MAKIAKEMSSYRLRPEVREAVRLMAEAGQVSQSDIVEEAVRLLAAKKKEGSARRSSEEVAARRSRPAE